MNIKCFTCGSNQSPEKERRIVYFEPVKIPENPKEREASSKSTRDKIRIRLGAAEATSDLVDSSVLGADKLPKEEDVAQRRVQAREAFESGRGIPRNLEGIRLKGRKLEGGIGASLFSFEGGFSVIAANKNVIDHALKQLALHEGELRAKPKNSKRERELKEWESLKNELIAARARFDDFKKYAQWVHDEPGRFLEIPRGVLGNNPKLARDLLFIAVRRQSEDIAGNRTNETNAASDAANRTARLKPTHEHVGKVQQLADEIGSEPLHEKRILKMPLFSRYAKNIQTFALNQSLGLPLDGEPQELKVAADVLGRWIIDFDTKHSSYSGKLAALRMLQAIPLPAGKRKREAAEKVRVQAARELEAARKDADKSIDGLVKVALEVDRRMKRVAAASEQNAKAKRMVMEDFARKIRGMDGITEEDFLIVIERVVTEKNGVAEAIVYYPADLKDTPRERAKYREFVIKLARHNGRVMEHVNCDEWLKDGGPEVKDQMTRFIKAAVAKEPEMFFRIPERWRDAHKDEYCKLFDEQILRDENAAALIARNSDLINAYQHPDKGKEHLRGETGAMWRLFEKRPDQFLKAIKDYPATAIPYFKRLGHGLYRRFAVETLLEDSTVAELWNDDDVLEAILVDRPELLNQAPPGVLTPAFFASRRRVFLEALKTDGHLFQYAPDTWKSDLRTVAQAASRNQDVLDHVPVAIRDHPLVQYYATKDVGHLGGVDAAGIGALLTPDPVVHGALSLSQQEAEKKKLGEEMGVLLNGGHLDADAAARAVKEYPELYTGQAVYKTPEFLTEVVNQDVDWVGKANIETDLWDELILSEEASVAVAKKIFKKQPNWLRHAQAPDAYKKNNEVCRVVIESEDCNLATATMVLGENPNLYPALTNDDVRNDPELRKSVVEHDVCNDVTIDTILAEDPNQYQNVPGPKRTPVRQRGAIMNEACNKAVATIILSEDPNLYPLSREHHRDFAVRRSVLANDKCVEAVAEVVLKEYPNLYVVVHDGLKVDTLRKVVLTHDKCNEATAIIVLNEDPNIYHLSLPHQRTPKVQESVLANDKCAPAVAEVVLKENPNLYGSVHDALKVDAVRRVVLQHEDCIEATAETILKENPNIYPIAHDFHNEKLRKQVVQHASCTAATALVVLNEDPDRIAEASFELLAKVVRVQALADAKKTVDAKPEVIKHLAGHPNYRVLALIAVKKDINLYKDVTDAQKDKAFITEILTVHNGSAAAEKLLQFAGENARKDPDVFQECIGMQGARPAFLRFAEKDAVLKLMRPGKMIHNEVALTQHISDALKRDRGFVDDAFNVLPRAKRRMLWNNVILEDADKTWLLDVKNWRGRF